MSLLRHPTAVVTFLTTPITLIPDRPNAESFSSPEVQAALEASSNIFFLRTTNETTLSIIERCALASAARQNPGRRVSIFSNSLDCEFVRSAASPAVHVVRFDPRDVYEGYPHFLAWHATGVWDMKFRGIHLSDSMRIALLHRFGGVYFDTDVVSLRSFDGLRNAVGLEDPWVLNNAVLAFERGHPFLAQAEHDFVDNFRPLWWGWNGPRMVTRVWMKGIAHKSRDPVVLAPVEEFYRISWREAEWRRLFAREDTGVVAQLFKGSRVLHFWHSLLQAELEAHRHDSNFAETVAGQIVWATCPNVLGTDFFKQSSPALPVLELAPLQEHTSSGGLWRDATPSAVLGSESNPPFSGTWELATCGFLDNAYGLGELIVDLPQGASWTLSFWINARTLDITSRLWPHHTPEPLTWGAENGGNGESFVCIPHCKMDIAAIPALPESAASQLVGDGSRGDSLLLVVEHGHFAVGDQRAEWVRSVSPVADGRWHHVGLAFDTGLRLVRLVLDGVLQAETARPGAVHLRAAVFGGPGDSRDLFISQLGFFDGTLSHSDLVRLRNTQLLRSTPQNCIPFVALFPPAPEKPRVARLFVLILSDGRPQSAAMRNSVRNSWLSLLPPSQLQHFFCIGSGDIHFGAGASMLDLEAIQHGDLVRVDTPDGYDFLSQKVLSCISAAVTSYGGTFDFLIKTDHDVFLRLDILKPELTERLVQHAASPERGEPLLHWQGFAYHSVPPMRDLSDKNADVSNTLLTFPPYTAGVAYVLSSRLAEELVAIEDPAFMLNEDQTLGVWMQQRLKQGGRLVLPLHDMRFQQWGVCFPGQLAHHFMDSPARMLRLVSYNIRKGLEACTDVQQSSCCLCCDCWASLHSWFRCDTRGAFLYMLTPLSSARPSSAEELSFSIHTIVEPHSSPSELFDRIVLNFPAACPWVPSGWSALGLSSISPCVDADGIALFCPAAPQRNIDYRRHFCASSISFRPQSPTPLAGTCARAPVVTSIIKSRGLGEDAFGFGHAGRCPWRINTPDPFEHLTDSWVLIAAWVDTLGACMLNNLEPETRARLLKPEHGYNGPPRFGSSSSFCGLYVDLEHADGSTSSWPSSFARNASRHFHAELIRVMNPSPVVGAVVTAIIPPSGTSASVTVSSVSIRRLRFFDGRDNSTFQDAVETLALYQWQLDPRNYRLRLAFRNNPCTEDAWILVLLLLSLPFFYIGARRLQRGLGSMIFHRSISALVSLWGRDLLTAKGRDD